MLSVLDELWSVIAEATNPRSIHSDQYAVAIEVLGPIALIIGLWPPWTALVICRPTVVNNPDNIPVWLHGTFRQPRPSSTTPSRRLVLVPSFQDGTDPKSLRSLWLKPLAAG